MTFRWANDAEDARRSWRAVSRTGSYLSQVAGINEGDPLAYLIAPPLEAAYGVDAAIKAAEVRLATFIEAPSETNYSGAFLAGSASLVHVFIITIYTECKGMKKK